MKKSNQPLLSLFHLGLAIHHLSQKAEKRLGMSLGQWCVLGHLIDMPATSAHALALAVGIHPSTLTQALKRMQRRNFVFITEDPKDSRKKMISITRFGKDAFDHADVIFGKYARKLAEVDANLLELRERIDSQIDFV